MDIWPRNDFIKHAQDSGASEDVAIAAWKQAKVVQSVKLPPILSLNHLAVHTNCQYKYLRKVVCRNFDPYRIFRIRKRSGGTRQICIPELGLAKVQTWINRHLLSQLDPHQASMAFSKGASTLNCASQHAGCRWLIKCDVEQFFESISEIQVYRVFLKAGYVPLVAFELARLCTRTYKSSPRYKLKRWRGRPYKQIASYFDSFVGHLPQGAPTSPKLSNLVMQDFDSELSNLANESNLTYTRYADVLFFQITMASLIGPRQKSGFARFSP